MPRFNVSIIASWSPRFSCSSASFEYASTS